MTMSIEIRETRDVRKEDIIAIYKANKWSSAEKPDLLYNALLNSHMFVTAWKEGKLVGLANAISDGYLVVYYPHVIIHPEHQGEGIGKMLLDRFEERYGGFHQQVLVSEENAVNFYQKCGFDKASTMQSMWVYKGNDH